MSKCTYVTLYYSKDGYVVKCVHCDKLQLAYGNVIVNLSIPEFQALRQEALDRIKKHTLTGFPEQKNITFYTDSINVRLVFSFKDLEVLYEILQQANLMLEVNNILLNQN